MPIFDMPLEQLLTYQGVNPKPKDFDEYWARALNEMHAMGTAHERVRADF
jgi:cephalosporin-C deacetylase